MATIRIENTVCDAADGRVVKLAQSPLEHLMTIVHVGEARLVKVNV